jgi:hypothetical protein
LTVGSYFALVNGFMRFGLRLILNSSVARGTGKSILIALIAFLSAIVLAANSAQASCGDYVMIGGHEGNALAGGPMAKTTDRSDGPAPAPCSGPECRRNAPAAPMTPPVKSNNLESRCFGALFDLTSASADADRGIWRDEIHIAIPDPALSRIFHPPR